MLMEADGYPFVEQQEDITGEPLRDVTNFHGEVLLNIPDIIKFKNERERGSEL